MASHRKSRPGGSGPGLRGPVLATAALTSVAVLSQTAEAAPADDGRPSPEEIEKKIDELYRRAEPTPQEESAARQRPRAGEPRQEGARRAVRTPAIAREGRVPFAAAPDTAASLLAEYPQDHFAQSRVLNRLASRVKDAAGRGRAPRGPEASAASAAPAAAWYDVTAAGAAAPAPEAGATAPATGADREAPGRAAPATTDRGTRAATAGRAAKATPLDQDAKADTPGYDVKAAKAAVQRKLAVTRALLSRHAASEDGARAELGPHLAAPTALPYTPTPPSLSPSPASYALPPTPPYPPLETSSHSPLETPSYAPSATPPYAPPATLPVTKAEKAIAFARAQIGKPYVSGASGPGSYDSSGLTQAAWRAAGVTLPRTAREQAAAGTPVPLIDARPGDLVFFRDDSSHVGLCTGDGMMIHAPEPGAYVREESVDRGGTSVVEGVVRPA
ncbi:NlpC/P60 family protein [Streptomyces sp. NPDC096012]|uniref:C40 family peptidase n=1 Tax=Streptomyces sp. NPDC096012 TaxID=3155684 RepID=UPI00336A3B4B